MRFFFCGAPSDPILRDVGRLGHDVHLDNWWNATRWRPLANRPWERYGRKLIEDVREQKPDVFILHKGWVGHGPEGTFRWHVPPFAIDQITKICPRMLYWCLDDPADTPVTLQLYGDVLPQFDAYLSGCPGIVELFGITVPVYEFWQGWDEDLDPETDANRLLADTIAITGSTYRQPFPAPHYQSGFSGPRRDLVRALLAKGLPVGLWGNGDWLVEERGGDPSFANLYHGQLPATDIHRVHGGAAACVGTHLVEGRRWDSGRLPWVMGAGGVLIHEDRPGLREEAEGAVLFFPPGDWQMAADLCGVVLSSPRLAEAMRQRGRRLVMEKHTWAVRAKRLVEIVSQL